LIQAEQRRLYPIIDKIYPCEYSIKVESEDFVLCSGSSRYLETGSPSADEKVAKKVTDIKARIVRVTFLIAIPGR